MLLSKEEFAKSQGFSSAYVRKLVRKGVIQPVNGQVDYEQALTAIESLKTSRLPRRKGIEETIDELQDELDDLENREASVATTTALSTLLLKTRIKNEFEKGRLLEVEARVKLGQYIDAQTVEKEAFKAARTARDALQIIPDRVSQQLASLNDPNKIYEILSKEIRLALEEIAEKLEDQP